MLLIQLLPIALFLGVSTVYLAKRPVVLLYMLLAVQFLVAGRMLPSASVGLMEINVGPVDLINVMVFTAAVLRMPRGPRGMQWALIGAIAIVIVGTLKGYLQLSDAALLGFRAELYFLVPALFVSTIPASSAPRIVSTIVVFGVLLAGVAVLRWGGLLPTDVESTGSYLIERVIPSNAALWVAIAAMAAVMTLFRGHEERLTRYPWAVAGLCAPVILFTQHRSVWVTMLVMLAFAFLITKQRILMKVSMILAAGIAIALLLLFEFRDSGGRVADSLAFATSNIGTWQWRIDRWGDVWETHSARGLGAVIVGSGYGYSWVTGVVGEWEASPHNGYLQIAVRLGLVGAFLVFFPYYLVVKRLLFAREPTSRLLWLWTIGFLIYYIPYSGNMLTGVVLGATIAVLTAMASDRQVRSFLAKSTVAGSPTLPQSAQETPIARKGRSY